MQYTWLAALYAKFGVAYPNLAYAGVFVLGGLFAMFIWWTIGLDYQRQENANTKATSTDSAIAQLRTDFGNLLNTRQDTEREIAKRHDLREKLSAFYTQGRRLRDRCGTDPERSTLQAESDRWFKRVQGFLKENFDASYLARFDTERPTAFQPGGVAPARIGLWTGLDQRVMVLEQFIAELAR